MGWYILVAIVSIIVGFTVSILWCYRKTTYGVLEVDGSNPNKPIFRFYIGDTTDITQKKQVILKVKPTTIDTNTQE